MSPQQVYEWLTAARRTIGLPIASREMCCMHVVVVFLEAEPGRQSELSDALVVYSKICLEREPGCERYDVSLDPVDSASFLLYQIYENEAAYLAHRELPHYADFKILIDPWTRSRRVLTYQAIALTETA
jgi:autoinducer 2-degrading protein